LASTVVGVASTAPAYSLASSLGFVVVLIGVSTPVVTILAFVPTLLISIGYKELNRADPDCGTTFTWATRAFSPRVGWMGGWGVVAADILVMPSLAQIAGQYVFLLFDAKGIGSQASSGWVLLIGVAWIIVMTVICYVGIEISAKLPEVPARDRARHARGPVRGGLGKGRQRLRPAGPPRAGVVVVRPLPGLVLLLH
jgi:amino acid transporter